MQITPISGDQAGFWVYWLVNAVGMCAAAVNDPQVTPKSSGLLHDIRRLMAKLVEQLRGGLIEGFSGSRQTSGSSPNSAGVPAEQPGHGESVCQTVAWKKERGR